MHGDTSFFDETPTGLALRVRLTPRAARNALGGVFTDDKGRAWLKAAVTAVPEKGRANAALITLLSKKLKIRKSAFAITAGDTDRHKTLSVADAGETIRQALLTLRGPASVS